MPTQPPPMRLSGLEPVTLTEDALFFRWVNVAPK